ncbi:uncharacterized protein LOC128964197 [Oppia nitens]|uniref:uncharacterized protein LOC128964197 n=1 Tax=Oppia nitens TaxID=1686743 RepID=UPI0023DB00FD|nr:uncharacterized protein LOC128964197 [Oppia nitens]
MSDPIESKESYEDLLKQLKPFSVVSQRLSAEEAAKHRVINDGDLIKDEVVIKVSTDDDDGTDLIEEEEIEVVLAEIETNVNDESLNEPNYGQFSCFFCKKKSQDFGSYREAYSHLQLHIDYFPIQCSICDEAIIDVLSFAKHCRKQHENLEKAVYIHKFNANFHNWIHTYLTTGTNESFKANPQKYCPACDWIHLSAPDVNNPNDTIPTPKPLQVLGHIHEHIHYLPFSCKICQQNGREYRIHVLDGCRKHFGTDHKELLDSPPFNSYFNKKYTISALDKFISNYLEIFGLKCPKMNKKSRKRSKPLSNTNSDTTPSTYVTMKTSIKSSDTEVVKVIQTPTNAGTTKPNIIQIVDPITTLNSLSINTSVNEVNGKVLIRFPHTYVSANQMETPLMILPSSNTLKLEPIAVESTDLGVLCLDPKVIEIEDKTFRYLCVFCGKDKIFPSSFDTQIHYAIHFDYHPVVCMICDKRFMDLSTLMSHYVVDHQKYQNNLFHFVKEDEKVEKWIQSFIDFQKTHEFKGLVSPVYGQHCFICDKLVKTKDNSLTIKFDKLIVNEIRDHIHQHLNYFPYKCAICLYGGRDVNFTTYNKSAEKHLYKFHGINFNDDKTKKEIYKLIIKFNEISQLEKFIDSKLFPNRTSDIENPIVINFKRKLEEIDSESKKRKLLELSKSSLVSNIGGINLSNVTNTTQSPITAQVVPMVRKVMPSVNVPQILATSVKTYSINQTISTTTTTTTNSNNRNNALKTILFSPTKMANGRQITLLPKIAPKPTPPTVNPIQVIPTKTTFVESFLICFHCRQRVANTSELESHHRSTHPKLTIASFTPNKADIIALSKPITLKY